VVVIDCSEGAAQNDDFELTPESSTYWEAEHGPIPAGSWVLMRTDWSKRSGADYLNMADDGPHSPGPTPAAIEALLKRGIRGFGTETVGTDAGQGIALYAALSGALSAARRREIRAAMPLPISISCPRPARS
jgi:kynurenine formamidase